MVSLLLELAAPSDRLWIIDQPVSIAARDAVHLLFRVALSCACTACA